MDYSRRSSNSQDVYTKWDDEWSTDKTMIKLEDFKKLGLTITWRLLYKAIYEKRMSVENAIAFAIEKLERGDERREICELAGSYTDERDDILNLLHELIQQENTEDDLEYRKIRAVIVSNTLRIKDNNYINGLMNLNDLWMKLDYPSDLLHAIQGKNNDITPDQYYTAENYNLLYKRNEDWLKGELEYLRGKQ